MHDTIVSLERAALERWGAGDPDGYLEISAGDVSYFDPFQPERLDDLTALRSLYDTIRGQIHIRRSEIVRPRVQLAGDAAVLTFQFISEGSEGSKHWNATEVYQRFEREWKIIHTHWSFTGVGSLPPGPSGGN